VNWKDVNASIARISPPLKLRGQTVIVVDDGLATGSSMHAAVTAIRQKQPKKIIVAVPVGARDTCESFHNEVDTIAICAITPETFQSVGAWYANFTPTTDDEVAKVSWTRSGLDKTGGVNRVGAKPTKDLYAPWATRFLRPLRGLFSSAGGWPHLF
jgi:predicted phosphoribosyltransferase